MSEIRLHSNGPQRRTTKGREVVREQKAESQQAKWLQSIVAPCAVREVSCRFGKVECILSMRLRVTKLGTQLVTGNLETYSMENRFDLTTNKPK